MVDTIGVAQAADFIPEIWANTALAILRGNIVVTPRVLRDSDVAAFNVGDKLNIPYPGTLAANDKAAGTAYVLSRPANANTVTVELTTHKAVSFVIEDIARAQANQDLMRRYSEASAIAIAEAIETDAIAELQTATNTDGTSAYGTDLVWATLLAARKKLTDLKAPMDGRSLVASTKDIVALLSDSDLATYFANSQTQGVSEGRLGRLAGFDVYESQFITTDVGPNPDETKNVAFRRDGAIIAFRGLPDPPANSGAAATTITDPDSGVVMRVVMAYRADLGGVQVTLEVLYGVAKLEEAKLLLVKS